MSAINAYKATDRAVSIPKQVEYDALIRLAHTLERKPELPYVEFLEALNLNVELWMALALDCAEEGNRLPKPLRAQIITLGMWVYRHSAKVMDGSEPATALIEVNRTIAKGLQDAMRHTAPAEPQPATAAAAPPPVGGLSISG